MSHFTLDIIHPSAVTGDNLTKHIEAVMSPFDENTEVDPYPHKCSCVGYDARRFATDEAWRAIGTYDVARAAFFERHPEFADLSPFDDRVDDAWFAEVVKPHDEKEAELLATRTDREAADPECDECSGTGLYQSTYNPKSKWDWWSVGGRWDGYMPNGKNTIDIGEALASDKFISPFAILTPDGQWIERGSMGWFAIVSDQKETREQWNEKVREILGKHTGCSITVVDCHI